MWVLMKNGDIVPIVHDEGSENRKHVDVSWGVTTDGIVSILVEGCLKFRQRMMLLKQESLHLKNN